MGIRAENSYPRVSYAHVCHKVWAVAGAVSKSEGGKDADSVASRWVLGGAVDTSMISGPSSLLAGT